MPDRPHLLLIEDSYDDERLVLRAVERYHVPIHVHIARSGYEGMDLLKHCDPLPFLVLLDLKLPGLSGFDLLQAMREDDRLRTVPVVCMSSSDDPYDLAKCNQLGANSYIVKSMDIRAHLGRLIQTFDYWLNVHQPFPYLPGSDPIAMELPPSAFDYLRTIRL